MILVINCFCAKYYQTTTPQAPSADSALNGACVPVPQKGDPNHGGYY